MTFRIRTIGREGFRRCGVRFTREGATFGEDRFKPEEWERLRAEPALAVEPAAEEAEGGEKRDEYTQRDAGEGAGSKPASGDSASEPATKPKGDKGKK